MRGCSRKYSRNLRKESWNFENFFRIKGGGFIKGVSKNTKFLRIKGGFLLSDPVYTLHASKSI